MPVRRNRRHAHRNAANCRDLRRNLGRRQDTALARFRTLAHFQLKHLHLAQIGYRLQLHRIELPVEIPDTVLRRTYLENDVAIPLQVPRRQRAFSRIEPAVGHCRALRQRPDGRFRQCPITHARDVHDRLRLIGVGTALADHHIGSGTAVLFQRREWAVHEDDGSNRPKVLRRSERNRIVVALGGSVDPLAFGAVERHLLAVHGEKVLPEEFAQRRENVAESADDGIVAANGVFRQRRR